MPSEKIPINNGLSWLYTITKNQTIDYLRKQHNSIDIDTIYCITEQDDKINEIIDIDDYNKMVDCLEEKEKEIVSLKVLTNYTFKEIGLLLDMPTATVQWKYYKAKHTLKIFITNLTMFIITFMLYIESKKRTEDKTDISNETSIIKQDNDQSIDFITSSTADGIDTTTSTQTVLFSNKIEIGLFSFSTIFLILTIIFGIIFTKYQQKRHHKSSK